MEAKTSDNFVAIPPKMLSELGGIERQIEALAKQKQALLFGFFAGAGIDSGDWEIMPDGSGFLRKDGPS